MHPPVFHSRRDVFKAIGATFGIACLTPLGRGLLTAARGAPTGSPFLVVVNMIGGNDGLNMVVPRTLQPYYDRRNLGEPGGIAIPPGEELSLAGGPGTTLYGLHPAMPALQAMWNDGDLAIFPKVGYPQHNLSHFVSQDVYSYGVRGEFSDLGMDESGWVARFADLYAATTMGAVSIGVGRPLDFLGGDTSLLQAQALSGFRYDVDGKYPQGHQHRIDTIRQVLENYTGPDEDVAAALLQGHEFADQIQAAVAGYQSNVDYGGQNPPNIARYLRDVATLVQHGFETKAFYTGFGGFDTHANQGAGTGSQATLLGRLDAALGAFAQDLKDMGAWDGAAIVAISEFGRRNYQNASSGTDHGGASFFLALGGAVTGGVYGSDLTEADLLLEYPAYQSDFRDIYREALDVHLGFPPDPVFPEEQPLHTTLGYL